MTDQETVFDFEGFYRALSATRESRARVKSLSLSGGYSMKLPNVVREQSGQCRNLRAAGGPVQRKSPGARRHRGFFEEENLLLELAADAPGQGFPGDGAAAGAFPAPLAEPVTRGSALGAGWQGLVSPLAVRQSPGTVNLLASAPFSPYTEPVLQ